MTDSDVGTISPIEREAAYRRNFRLFLVDAIMFTVAMGIIGPSTVIPDFIRRLTDSEVLIGLSSSLFDIGWMLPQLFMARYLVRVARKKWWFAGPNIVVRFAIPVFAVIILLLGAERRGAILLAFLICYGIAAVGDGIVGVPWVDLVGSSLDDHRRARLFGFMTAISGVIMLGVAPLVGLILSERGPGFPGNYALLFGIAGALFLISIVPPLFLKELPSGKATETILPFREYIPQLGRVLRDDRAFRAMIIVRMLSSLFMMGGPFYIGFATVRLGLSSEVAVPTLLAMQTIGTISGALVYAWMGARHNLLYIRLALLLVAVLPASALLARVAGPLPLYAGFFAAGLALSNLFASYLNWIIMHATPEQRPIYTGLFNTVAAVTLLTAPLIGGTLAEAVGYEAVFAVALAMALGAFYVVMHYIPTPRPVPAETEPAPVAGPAG